MDRKYSVSHGGRVGGIAFVLHGENVLGRGAGLDLSIRMSLVADLHVKVSACLESSTNVQYAFFVLRLTSPDSNLVHFSPNVDNSTADLVAVLTKGLTDQAQERIEPQLIDVTALLLVDDEKPAATLPVAVVFPHWFDANLEYVVITSNGKVAGKLNVIVQGPEVFHCIKLSNLQQVILPAAALVRPEVPQLPLALQRVLYALRLTNGQSNSGFGVLFTGNLLIAVALIDVLFTNSHCSKVRKVRFNGSVW